MKVTRLTKLETDFDIERKFDECIYLNKLGLLWIGLWPYRNDTMLLYTLLRKIHLFLIYILMLFVIIPQWFDIYTLWGDIDANTETFLSNVFIFAVMIKIFNFLKSMNIFKEILEIMRSNWIQVMKMSDYQQNKDIMYHLTVKARHHSTNYGFIVFSVAILYCIMPLMDMKGPVGKRKYPFFGRYYFDGNSDIIYGMCYAIQIITGSVVGIANYATDTIFLVCIYHFCAQLRILQNDLLSLGRDKDNSCIEQRKRVISLIRRHQVEIRNARALQSIFSGTSCQQLLVSCLMICVNGFKLIVSLNNRDIDFIRYLVCMPLTLFQILFYCQPGNELIVQSQSLDEAIYQSSWINLDQASIRHLIFMIQRSQKPLAITAGKIYVLSLENFMKILKTGMSALSVLQAMYRKDA